MLFVPLSGREAVVEEVEQLADGAVAVEVVPERELGVELVAVASADAASGEVAGLFEVEHDLVGGPLADPDAVGELPDRGLRLAGDAGEEVEVVGEEQPAPTRAVIVVLATTDCTRFY